MPHTGKAVRNPLRVVLLDELLVTCRAATVSRGIAPAINEVAAFAVLATAVARGFLGRRAVVNDPNLVAAADAQGDLVKLFVVIERVYVVPERGRRREIRP